METALVAAGIGRRQETTATIDTIEPLFQDMGTPFVSDILGVAEPAVLRVGAGGAAGIRVETSVLGRITKWWHLVPLEAPVLPVQRSVGASVSALDAVLALMELFDLRMETVASAAGLGRTTVLYWQRTGSVPRPSTVNRLWRMYGLGLGIRQRLGVAGARSWVRGGMPSPLNMLGAGDWEAFERAASAVAIEHGVARRFEPAVSVSGADATEPRSARAGRPAAGSRRRVRRGRLG